MRDKRDGAAVEGHRKERVKALLHTHARRRTLRAAIAIAIACSAGVASMLIARQASAQEWTKDRRLGDGKGYRTGDIELHPGLGAEFGYDSNYFLRSDKTSVALQNGAPAVPVRDGELLRITPSITINTVAPSSNPDGTPIEPPKYAFKAGLSGSYYQFFGPQELRDQGNNVSVNADARLDVFQGRPIGFAVWANYSRVLRPSIDGDPDNAFNRDNIGAGTELIFTPGGGTFDFRAGYQFGTQLFEQSDAQSYTSYTNEIDVKTRWRFRPRTALFNDNTIGFVNYPNQSATSLNPIANSTPVTTRFGITGLITPRFSALADIGYGTTLENDAGNPATSQYDSVIGNAEATFFLSANPADADPGQVSLSVSTLTLGYARDFQRSFLASGYYGSDRGFAKLVYLFGNKATLSLTAGIGAIEYPSIFVNTLSGGPKQINDAFTDVRLTSTLFGEYHILESLGINATLDYSQNFSNTILDYSKATGVGANSPGSQYDMAWKRFQAILGVRYFL